MERRFSLNYYRNGLATFSTCDSPLELLHRLIILLNDFQVKDIRVTEYCSVDTIVDDK